MKEDNMKRIFFFLLLWTTAAWAQKADLDAMGWPCACDVVHRLGYSVCYNNSYEQPSWVAYKLTKAELDHRVVTTSSSYWRKDLDVPGESVSSDDYTNTQYSRGHMAPKADMRWSKEAYKQSFFMSNVCPQKQDFNNQVWGDLEDWVRAEARNHSALYIVAGPLLRSGLPVISGTEIAVPDSFFKVILYKHGSYSRAIGFVIPTTAIEEDFRDYAVPVDEVEKVTGLDFFSKLSDPVEKKVEAKVDMDWWFPDQE
jgi:endonuclease G